MGDERKQFEGALKIKVDLISELRCENSELLKRLAAFDEGPTTTQLYESQAVMAQLELTEKVAILQQEKEAMLKLIADLTKKIVIGSNKDYKGKGGASSGNKVVEDNQTACTDKGKETESKGVQGLNEETDINEGVQGLNEETPISTCEETETVLETQPGSTLTYDNLENVGRLSEIPDVVAPDLLCDSVKEDLAEGIINEMTPGDKGKGIASQQSPKSMYKRVKGRTDKGDRRKVVTSPQMNTNEIVTVHEGYDDEEIERDMILLKSAEKCPFDKSILAVKKTTEHVKNEIAFYLITKGPNHVVFRGVQPFAEVTVENMMQILHNRRLSNAVIDAWADLVQKKYSPISRATKFTMVFTLLCWDLISTRCGNGKKMFETLIEKRFKEVMDMEILVFLILAGGEQSTTRGVGDHWTLLKLNVPKSTWSFYNSQRPRADGLVDQHLKQSLIVVKYIDSKLGEVFKKARPTNRFLMSPLVLPSTESCVQQASGSLDCGVVVCNHLEKIMKGKPFLKGEFTLNAAAMYRARLATWFMEQ